MEDIIIARISHNVRIMQNVTDRDIVSSGPASRAVGISRSQLVVWWHEGKIKPVYTTPGAGHPRWSITSLRRQLHIEESK